MVKSYVFIRDKGLEPVPLKVIKNHFEEPKHYNSTTRAGHFENRQVYCVRVDKELTEKQYAALKELIEEST